MKDDIIRINEYNKNLLKENKKLELNIQKYKNFEKDIKNLIKQENKNINENMKKIFEENKNNANEIINLKESIKKIKDNYDKQIEELKNKNDVNEGAMIETKELINKGLLIPNVRKKDNKNKYHKFNTLNNSSEYNSNNNSDNKIENHGNKIKDKLNKNKNKVNETINKNVLPEFNSSNEKDNIIKRKQIPSNKSRLIPRYEFYNFSNKNIHETNKSQNKDKLNQIKDINNINLRFSPNNLKGRNTLIDEDQNINDILYL